MNLDSTSKVFQVVLGEAKTTTDCDVVSAWADQTASAFTPGSTMTVSNGVTAVTAAAAPASSTQRNVTEVRVHNNDTVTHSVTYQIFDGVNTRILLKENILAGGDSVYTPGKVPCTSLFPILQGHLGGVGITVASTITFQVAAGQAMSDDNTALMTLAAATTKSSAGTWVVGSGSNGLDTGAIANTTWYHVYLIYNPTSNITDVLFSTSASSPTMPTGYTKKRRIGSLLTNGSAQFITFFQNGDRFDWAVPIVNFIAAPGVTTAVTQALTTPLGVVCEAILSGIISDSSASDTVLYLSSLAQTDTAPAAANGTVTTESGVAAVGVAGTYAGVRLITNTSSQIRRRVGTTTATIAIITNGWVDSRGRG